VNTDVGNLSPRSFDAETDGEQTTLSQGRAIETVLETVRNLQDERDGPVPIDDVVDDLPMDDDRAHTFVDKLLTDGQLHQPETGRVATP
jgi:DNA replicative helicase MCM subunit Mcm2 (Cdc46/Mcm family)